MLASQIHVCLTPPNTMLKVQKHINECKDEVKTNIFNEAFSLIHEHSFKHPHELHDLHTIDLHDDVHGLDLHNLTLTEQEILKFFEDHDHVGDHLGLIDESLPSAIPSLAPLTIEPTFLPPWQQPFPNHLYKKTDSIQLNGKSSSDDMQRSASAQKSSVRNPYQYFNIKTGEANKRIDRQRRDLHLFKHLLKDHHHSDDTSHHEDTIDTIHSTAIDHKDKRIAGVSEFEFTVFLIEYFLNCAFGFQCLMHCLYDKDNAIDHHTGYPTLDGLVNFYSDGVHEHGFFMSTLRAVDYCLKGTSHKYHINRHVKPSSYQ